MTALSVSALHHTYGAQPVLRGLTLNVEPGAVTAILGASGSGKTTLLRVIAGFERAKKGVVRLSGATVDDGRRFVPPAPSTPVEMRAVFGVFPVSVAVYGTPDETPSVGEIVNPVNTA